MPADHQSVPAALRSSQERTSWPLRAAARAQCSTAKVAATRAAVMQPQAAAGLDHRLISSCWCMQQSQQCVASPGVVWYQVCGVVRAVFLYSLYVQLPPSRPTPSQPFMTQMDPGTVALRPRSCTSDGIPDSIRSAAYLLSSRCQRRSQPAAACHCRCSHLPHTEAARAAIHGLHGLRDLSRSCHPS